jgi:hypothetical protein
MEKLFFYAKKKKSNFLPQKCDIKCMYILMLYAVLVRKKFHHPFCENTKLDWKFICEEANNIYDVTFCILGKTQSDILKLLLL